jgi:hypothetical protein
MPRANLPLRCIHTQIAFFSILVFSSPASSNGVDLSDASSTQQLIRCPLQTRLPFPQTEQATATPLLLFTTPLSDLPLELLRNTFTLAFALPSSTPQPGPTGDAAIRAVLRAGVHVAMPAALSRRFYAATGRAPLFSTRNPTSIELSPGDVISPPFRALYLVDPQNAGTSLSNADAIGWLQNQAGIAASPDAMAKSQELSKKMMTADQERCAYLHLGCDFVADGEVFRSICQSLRSNFMAREGGDIFKFASHIDQDMSMSSETSLISAGISSLQGPFNVLHRRRTMSPFIAEGFVAKNRDRIEASYALLISQSAIAGEPIKIVLHSLFAVNDTTMVSATTTGYLRAALTHIVASSRYEELLSAIKCLLGILLIALGTKHFVVAKCRLSGFYSPKLVGHFTTAYPWTSNRISQKRNRDVRRLRVSSFSDGVPLPAFLVSRAQNLSKAM